MALRLVCIEYCSLGSPFLLEAGCILQFMSEICRECTGSMLTAAVSNRLQRPNSKKEGRKGEGSTSVYLIMKLSQHEISLFGRAT